MTANTPLRTAPTRPGSFILGSMKQFQQENLQLFVNAAKQQGDVVRMRFATYQVYLISHPDGAQHILQSNNRNYGRSTYGNELIKRITGLNLFTSEGDYWLRQRRLMQPAFHRRRLENFNDIMVNATLRLLDRWAPAIEQGEPLDMHTEMTFITTDIVGRALFSVDLTDRSSELGNAFRISTEYLNEGFRQPVSLPLWVPTRGNRKARWAIHTTRRIIQGMIDERRRSDHNYDDLLEMLMEVRDEESGEMMTDDQLRRESTIVIGAGQETTSNLLTWTFHVLAANPEIEKRLLTEIDTVLEGRKPSMSDLPRLPYLRMLVDEVLRLYPPAWTLSARNTLEDDAVLGYRIPKGSLVFVMPFILQRDPRFWEDPEAVIPERFSEENQEKIHKYAYIPFGAGPRKCIGNTFALIEAQLILATLLQRVRLELVSGKQVKLDPAFTLRIQDGLQMHIIPR